MHTVAPTIDFVEHYAALSAGAGTVDTTGFDLSLYHGQLDALISVGSVGTGGTLDAKWQESDDNSTYTDCSGADAQGNNPAITQITAAGSVHLKRQVRKFTKRYARLRIVRAGTGPVVANVALVRFPNKAE